MRLTRGLCHACITTEGPYVQCVSSDNTPYLLCWGCFNEALKRKERAKPDMREFRNPSGGAEKAAPYDGLIDCSEYPTTEVRQTTRGYVEEKVG